MVRTRFAPSPTGSMHIGNLRTAFYAYALAKHEGGDFILRIENTDKKREKTGGIEETKKLLGVFGIKWDEYYIQAQRLDLYKKAAENLVSLGHAYRDKGAIRLKITRDEKISFRDFVLDKEVVWDTNTLEELVLLKSDGFPTYHLASVVDDYEMKVSHVLRGHDWLPSTPIHLLIYKYLGYRLPQIGHLTDILDPEGGKLSKRKGSVSVEGMLSEGYLPEALFNFVILLGWAPKDNRELFILDEFVRVFDHTGFQKANPIFNRKKLDWFNGHYIRQKTDKELAQLLQPFAPMSFDKTLIQKTIPLVKERLVKLSDYVALTEFLVKEPVIDWSMYADKIESPVLVKEQLGRVVQLLKSAKSWRAAELEAKARDLATAHHWSFGSFFMAIRITLTGRNISPPLFACFELLGRDKSIVRLKKTLVTKWFLD
ncbi:MAG: glutamate--tRNA ligase family protein [Candidatus Shapirobacteria bacterium]